MLLLSAALLAVACYAMKTTKALDERKSKLKSGWWLIAFTLFALSFDELGSFHEMIPLSLLDVNPQFLITVMIIFIPILIVMLMFSWHYLRHQPKTLLLFIVGVALIATIPVQEKFELSLMAKQQVNDVWRRPALHVVLEEGAKLFASLSFILGFVYYLQAQVKSNERMMISPFRLPGIAAIALVFTVLSWITYFFGHVEPNTMNEVGIATNWFPSAIAFISSIVLILNGSPLSHRYFVMLLSIYFGTNFYYLIYWNSIWPLTSVVAFLLLTGFLTFNHYHFNIKRLVWSALIILVCAFDNPISTPIITFLITIFTAWQLLSSKEGNIMIRDNNR